MHPPEKLKCKLLMSDVHAEIDRRTGVTICPFHHFGNRGWGGGGGGNKMTINGCFST